jgi:glutamyl-tRNA reductase
MNRRTSDATPLRVLVTGYGVMTAGIVSNLPDRPGTEVALVSRHLDAAPDPRVELVDEPTLHLQPCDVVLGCFESDEASEAFWTADATRRMLTSSRS